MKNYVPILKAMANSNRLKILNLLKQEELNVGNLEKALTIKANKFSETAIQKINKVGGKAEVL